jgi:hypothetical protein
MHGLGFGQNTAIPVDAERMRSKLLKRVGSRGASSVSLSRATFAVDCLSPRLLNELVR